ncbi:MAG: DUF423 domain-containing protein [Steroidobacteraceae bacterium]
MAAGGSLGRGPLALGAVLLALATIAGAVGAHALPHDWPALRVHVYDVAVRYQFYQSLGLLGMGLWLNGRAPAGLPAPMTPAMQQGRTSARVLVVGIVLFCGSLYALCLGVPRWVGVLTPLGGSLMIVAWAWFALAIWRS